jgi:hypothetical protein
VSEGTAPGPVLRAAAVGGAVAAAVVVASAALSSGEAHKGVALVALPLLAGVAAAALWAYPRLVAPAAIAFLLMLAAVGSGGLVAALESLQRELSRQCLYCRRRHQQSGLGSALGNFCPVLAVTEGKSFGSPQRDKEGGADAFRASPQGK